MDWCVQRRLSLGRARGQRAEGLLPDAALGLRSTKLERITHDGRPRQCNGALTGVIYDREMAN
jgi:hypothetical protein